MIRKDYLSHAHTPDELSAINQSICAVLEIENVDDQALRKFVTQRDEFIQSHLKSLIEAERKLFAEAELPINEKLHIAVQALFADSLAELSGLVRGLKAVKKYK
ncbi:MAG: hypothetical protein ACI97K_002959 [Glaciecola sp.]